MFETFDGAGEAFPSIDAEGAGGTRSIASTGIEALDYARACAEAEGGVGADEDVGWAYLLSILNF